MAAKEPMIEGMQTVSVHVNDVARSHRFFGEVLALRELEFQREGRRAGFSIPGRATVLSMHEMLDPTEEGRPPGTVNGIIFTSREPARALATIRAGGGSVTREVYTLPSRAVRGVFADPDGNEFVLSSPP